MRSTALRNVYRNFAWRDAAGGWSVQANDCRIYTFRTRRSETCCTAGLSTYPEETGLSLVISETMNKVVDSTPKQPGPLDRCIAILLRLVQPLPDASPTFAKEESVPVLSHWSCNVFILAHALWPGLLRLAYSRLYNGQTFPFVGTVLLYHASHLYTMAREGIALIKIGEK